jgi:hypothetical protein
MVQHLGFGYASPSAAQAVMPHTEKAFNHIYNLYKNLNFSVFFNVN